MLITATKCDAVERNTRLEVESIEQGFDEDNGVRHLNGLAFVRNGRLGFTVHWRRHTGSQINAVFASCREHRQRNNPIRRVSRSPKLSVVRDLQRGREHELRLHHA